MADDERARWPLGLTVRAGEPCPEPLDALADDWSAREILDGDGPLTLLRCVLGDPAARAPRVPARVAGPAGGPAGLYGWRCERWHVVIPVRGAHEALSRCLASLGELEDSDSLDVTIVCPIDERPTVQRIADASRFPTYFGGQNRHAVIPTAEPCGFSRNCNEGVEDYWPDSDVVVFLNSDADVTKLVSLRGAFAVALGIADAVGPSGTNVSGFQSENVQWTTDIGAARLAGRCVALRPPIPRLVGFCLAVRLGAFRDVGGWDESLSNFSDDDLSLRLALRSAPGRPSLLWVPSALVEHEGQASFRELPDPEAAYAQDMADGEKRFRARWGWTLPAISEWWRTI